MSVNVQRLNRVFRVSTQTFPDPAPTETPERAFAMLAVGMPALAHYTLDPPTIESGRLVYVAVRPPAQTKGAPHRRTTTAAPSPEQTADARDALDAWADAASTATYDEVLHRRVAGTLLAFSRHTPGKVDPFVLAMP